MGNGTGDKDSSGFKKPQRGGMLSREVATERLRKTGSRMTAQRNAVLELLEGNRTHPTAEAIVQDVQKRLGYVSPATIYNTLLSLEELGLIRRIEGLETKAHFDPDTSDHEHAICLQCKKVIDVYLDPIQIPGFTVRDVVIHGICDICSSNAEHKQK